MQNSTHRNILRALAALMAATLIALIAVFMVPGLLRHTPTLTPSAQPNLTPTTGESIPVTGKPRPLYLPLVSAGGAVPQGPTPQPAPPSSGDPVLVGAGDVARCNVSGDEGTAALVKSIPGTVMMIGDAAYQNGSASDFANCYDPSWGAFKDRTRPAVGNHEYMSSSSAAPFQNYFGAAAGPAGKFYYSYDLGTWHIVVLNSECGNVAGGCTAGSAQETWLKNDLAAHPNQCTLAYFHEPLFSSGEHGNAGDMKLFWQDLYNAGIELVVNGHDHDYERFAPMDPNGKVDEAKGIREFVVGSGGGVQRPWGAIKANSVARYVIYGVIKLTLHDGSYDWQFVPIAGQTANDSGSASCH